jgi:hypothetical protein
MESEVEERVAKLENNFRLIQEEHQRAFGELSNSLNRLAGSFEDLSGDLRMVASKFDLAIEFTKSAIPFRVVVSIFALVFGLVFGFKGLNWYFDSYLHSSSAASQVMQSLDR